jgi:hypothetical protein
MTRLALLTLLALPGLAAAGPDFQITELVAYCDPVTGLPELSVRVKNQGWDTASTYLDLFGDLPWAPTFGDWSDHYWSTAALGPLEEELYTVSLPYAARKVMWLDAIVDTDDLWLEAYEDDNQMSYLADFSTCL